MKRRRIFWQIFPAYLVIILLSVSATSWYAFHISENFYLNQTRTNLETQAWLLAKQVVRLMNPLDSGALDRLCKEAARGRDTRLTIVLANGTVVGDSEEAPAHMENHRNRPEISAAYHGTPASSVRFSGTLNQRMMYVAVPLKQNDRVLGVLRTSLAVTAIDQQRHAVRLEITVIAAVIILFATLVCFYLSIRFARPIEEMKNSAARFANGDLDHRLAEPQTTELAQLASAMNRMAGQLKNRMTVVISQRNELESVLESMIEGVIALDPEDQILRMNTAAALFFGISPDGFKGKSIQEVVRNQRLPELISRCAATLETVVDDIHIYKEGGEVDTADGMIVNTCCAPLRDENGKLVGTLLVFNDVTQLRQLENMRRDFAANVSHEIKTPLTAIKGFVETLLNEKSMEDGEQTHKFLTIIARHVDRLTAVIEDLMYLSRIERANEITSQKLERIQIDSVLNTALLLCKEKAEQKNITIQLQGDASALIDATLIEQATVNLLDNAIKYSPADSKINIHTFVKDGEVQIQFIDEGIGIDPKHLPRLFERFYRVDKSRSRKVGGTGLGLAIVKHIAQAHGGHVSVTSRKGMGSRFTLHLPIKDTSRYVENIAELS